MKQHFKEGLIMTLKFYAKELNGLLTKDDVMNIQFATEKIEKGSGYYTNGRIVIDSDKCKTPFRVSFVLVHELWHYIQYSKNERLLLDHDACYYDYENSYEWNTRHVEAEACFIQCLYLLWSIDTGDYNSDDINVVMQRTIHLIDKDVWNSIITKLDNNELKNKLSWRG